MSRIAMVQRFLLVSDESPTGGGCRWTGGREGFGRHTHKTCPLSLIVVCVSWRVVGSFLRVTLLANMAGSARLICRAPANPCVCVRRVAFLEPKGNLSQLSRQPCGVPALGATG